MSAELIKNFIQVTPHIASSGQPLAHEFKDIANDDYKLVVNLAMSDSDYAIANEESIVTSLGMRYVHIPVPFGAPDISQLKSFFKLMDTCRGEKVWVHCALNYRVSAFLFLYKRLIEGVSEPEAKEAILPSWEPDQVWNKFLKTTKKDLTSTSKEMNSKEIE